MSNVFDPRIHPGTPEPGSEIEFVHLGKTFTGRYIGQSPPWGTAWYIETGFYGPFVSERSIPRNQISEWSYLRESAEALSEPRRSWLSRLLGR